MSVGMFIFRNALLQLCGDAMDGPPGILKCLQMRAARTEGRTQTTPNDCIAGSFHTRRKSITAWSTHRRADQRDDLASLARTVYSPSAPLSSFRCAIAVLKSGGKGSTG